jgi:hypothetical protein
MVFNSWWQNECFCLSPHLAKFVAHPASSAWGRWGSFIRVKQSHHDGHFYNITKLDWYRIHQVTDAKDVYNNP